MAKNPRAMKGVKGLTSLNEVLDREGIREKVELLAFKRLLVLKLKQEMEAQQLSKSEMARLMGTSRAQLDRVLDPDAFNITIETVARAAQTLGRTLRLDLA